MTVGGFGCAPDCDVAIQDFYTFLSGIMQVMTVKTTKAFEDNYAMLNPEQRQAVDTIEGPVMVVAGPGTGKTQILTLRIANILKQTDTDPGNILALTFTEAAAGNMRKRLAKLTGNSAHEVEIATFHGFSNSIINRFPEYFGNILDAKAMTQVDQVEVIQQLMLDIDDLEVLRPFGDTFYYVRPIISSINQLKREGVSPEKFAQVVVKEKSIFEAVEDLYYDSGAHKGKMKGKYQKQARQIDKNEELAKIYATYQKTIREQKRYDFADMIMETITALTENEDLLLQVQEQYQYILVDEHQDSNNAQNKLLELVASFYDNPNLFVVGDEKQSIFRFQGASLENFYYFKHRYPEAVLVTLRQNYRSTQSILNTAHDLLTGPEELQANVKYEEQPISVYAVPDTDTEHYFVASEISKLIESGVSGSEIAVLYRNNRDAYPSGHMLDKLGVPFVIESDEDLFSDTELAKLILVLRAVNDLSDSEALAKALHVDFLGLDQLDVFKLIRSSSQKRKYTLADIVAAPDLQKDLGLRNTKALDELYANLEHWAQRSHNVDLITFMEEVVRQSGYLQHVLALPNAAEHLDTLDDLLGEARSLLEGGKASLADFFQYLDTLSKHNMATPKKRRRRNADKVRLMTAHRSKGLEFDYVFIVGAYSGHWGNKRKVELLPLLEGAFLYDDTVDSPQLELQANDDERRLFYVALTRAKQHVMISYAEQGSDGKEQLPSPFIDEITDDLIEYADTGSVAEEWRERRELLFASPTVKGHDFADPDFVRNLFIKTGFSVSALNNYLKSPWQYFYRNLLRIPSAPSKHQAYGIAVHAAVHDLFEAFKHSQPADSMFLVDRFRHHLDQQGYLSEAEYKESLQKGEVNLAYWYDAYSSDWNRQTLNEFRVNGVYLSEDVRLTGVFDKVEFISDTEVNVVDYKTGKPKTRNHIMGNTKDSTGDYYRQLVFYKLLLRHFQGGRYKMVSGEIDFIEPDTKGNFRKEKFEITDSEVDELEQTILQAAEDIMNLRFWDQTCDPEKCDYCDLWELLKTG